MRDTYLTLDRFSQAKERICQRAKKIEPQVPEPRSPKARIRVNILVSIKST